MRNSKMNDPAMAADLRETDILKAAYKECNAPEDYCHCDYQLPLFPARDQKQTGRCWIEAGIGYIEYLTYKETGVLLPKLSSDYIAYHDLRLKIRLFLEHMDKTRDLPVDNALIAHFLEKPVQDAGQWAVFLSLIKKHGVMPAEFTGHSLHHENTHTLLAGLCQKLRYCAYRIREDNASVADMENEVYPLLDSCFGIPPESFEYEGLSHTPMSFFRKYVQNTVLSDEISFICVPSSERAFYTAYRNKWLYSNEETGSPVVHYNIPQDLFRTMAAEQLKEGIPVWIGADASKFASKEKGIFDTGMYDFETLFDTKLDLPKGDSILYHDSSISHAMLLWGVSCNDGVPDSWCVRNSFGTSVGQGGYAWMSGGWFERYVYQAVIKRDIASRFMDCDKVADAPVIMLEPWDAIGCLA